MWYEDKLMRTLRCRTVQKPGALAASRAIADAAPAGDLVPNPLDRQLHRKVAQAVARVALERGLNRDDLNGYFD